jgi:hypothetical protein
MLSAGTPNDAASTASAGAGPKAATKPPPIEGPMSDPTCKPARGQFTLGQGTPIASVAPLATPILAAALRLVTAIVPTGQPEFL